MLLIYRRIFLWLLLACTSVMAQSKRDLPITHALKQGREAFFAFRINQATQQFRQVIQNDKDPVNQAMAQYHLSAMAVWQFGFGQTTAGLNEFKTQNAALNTALRYVNDPLWRRFLTAESAMHRAIVGVLRNDMLGAAMSGREAYNNYVWCIEQDPYFEEAYKGMGLMQVLIGSAPRAYQGLLGFLGYRGTVQDGLNHLERAIKKAKWVQEEAAIYFALSDEILNQNERNGIQKLSELQKVYPQSPLFNFLYGYALRNKFKAREALPYLEAAARSGKKSETVSPAIFLFYLGELYFRLNQYDEAIRDFTRFTQEFEGTTLVGQAYFKMGQALEMGGDRTAAVAMYQKVKAGFAYDMDEFALRQAALRIETPMTPVEKQLLRLQNASDAGDYAFVLTEVENILSQTTISSVNLAEAHYRKGLALQKAQRYEEAIVFYARAVQNPGDPLAKWGPYSQLYIGECYEALQQPENAILAYRKALMYREKFDYHKGLEQRAKTALSRLKAGN